MTIEDLNTWIRNHKYITNMNDDYDSCGNHEETRVYEGTDGKLFAISFSNYQPYERWVKNDGDGGGGFVRGEYDYPVEVFKKRRMEEYYDYNP